MSTATTTTVAAAANTTVTLAPLDTDSSDDEGEPPFQQTVWTLPLDAGQHDQPHAKALMALCSASHGAMPTQTDIDENVAAALADESTAAKVVTATFFMRNHAKSMANRGGSASGGTAAVSGSGERQLSERMFLALCRADLPAALAVAHLLPFYGSFKTVTNLLLDARKLAQADGCSAADQALWAAVMDALHELYARQLALDIAAADAGEGVSNASKFAPHEGRRRDHKASAWHADRIAARLYGDSGAGAAAVAVPEKGSPAHLALRTRFRKDRVRLNNVNAHIAEKYLSERRAGELTDARLITAGAMKSMRAGLLNITRKTKAERSTDPGRRALRGVIAAALAKSPAAAVAAPSDLRALADELLKPDLDPLEEQVLAAGYANVVRGVASKVQARMREARGLVDQLTGGGAPAVAAAAAAAAGKPLAALTPADAVARELAAQLAHDPSQCVVGIDCTSSQTGTVPTAALMALLFTDVEHAFWAQRRERLLKKKRKATARRAGGGYHDGSVDARAAAAADVADDDGAVPPPAFAVLFRQTAQLVEIQPAGVVATPQQRLRALVDSARELAQSRDAHFGAEGGVAGAANFDAALRLMTTGSPGIPGAGPEHFAGRHLVVCSDFNKADAFVEALDAWRGREAEERLCGDGAGGVAATAGGAPSAAQAAAAAAEAEARVVTAWRMVAPVGSTRKRGRVPVFDRAHPVLWLTIVMDTTGSMGSWIGYAKAQIRTLLGQLRGTTGAAVRVSFVSYKDFGDSGHTTACGWTDAANAAGMARLERFIGGLRPSGGGDLPEDVAEGLDQATKLMRAAGDGMKAVVLVADAPGHGFMPQSYGASSDNHLKRRGVCQRKRTLESVRALAGTGAELMFAQCQNDKLLGSMTAAFNGELQACGTFVDAFHVGGMAGTVFADKVRGSVEAFALQALAPPDATGVDIVAGTDPAVPTGMLQARFSDAMLRAVDLLEEAKVAKAAATAAGGGDAPALPAAAEVDGGGGGGGGGAAAPPRVAKSALSLLEAKLASAVYDPVRLALSGGASAGRFRDFEFRRPLAEQSCRALAAHGVTGDGLRACGYPAHAIDEFEGVVKRMATGR